ncbi:hypothetical protein [uncultured Algibacter sp.]|uniref:hypothetical protein n=1 Tax=uncultured Algibacter sp. TaxID=298659 RepID=UPI0030ED5978|tara:strand:- start:4229 stop:4885 length:657 start_codon:yes stop_codon:yes gene_type:complete
MFFLFSCGNEKALLLPEISHSEISEIQDVSHAYLFYDETQKDSVELNRKNLISTTNWLINVDKRLTLKQAIPHIKYLQDKKNNSSHKNKEAKNYFTCNDISRKNLGFIEFTDVIYNNESLDDYSGELSNVQDESNSTAIGFETNNKITIASKSLKTFITEITKDSLSFYLKKTDKINGMILLNFNEDLSFQNYIEYKSIIKNVNLKQSKVLDKEFIFN